MSKLDDFLGPLGLQEYSERLASHGFETWDDLVEISEEMMEEVGLKRGHRRKLQRGIASCQGKPYSNPLPNLNADGESGEDEDSVADIKSENREEIHQVPTPKRRYRRHEPKDPFAPIRSKSDYVLFSNHMRQDPQVRALAFVDVSKHVGKAWQSLLPEERTKWASRAADDKLRYEREIAQYKQTDNYRRHQDRLRSQKSENLELEDSNTISRGLQSLGDYASSWPLPDTSPMRSSSVKDYFSDGNRKRSPVEQRDYQKHVQSSANSSLGSSGSPLQLFQLEQAPFKHHYSEWNQDTCSSPEQVRRASMVDNFNSTDSPHWQRSFGASFSNIKGSTGTTFGKNSPERPKSFHILHLNPFHKIPTVEVWPFLDSFLKTVNTADHYVDSLEAIQSYEMVLDSSLSLPNHITYTLCFCVSIGCQISPSGTDETAIMWYENGRRYLDNDDWECSLEVMLALALVSRFHRSERPTTARHYLEIAMKIGEANNLSAYMEIDSNVDDAPNKKWVLVWATIQRMASN